VSDQHCIIEAEAELLNGVEQEIQLVCSAICSRRVMSYSIRLLQMSLVSLVLSWNAWTGQH
jgi:hypothetical protein